MLETSLCTQVLGGMDNNPLTTYKYRQAEVCSAHDTRQVKWPVIHGRRSEGTAAIKADDQIFFLSTPDVGKGRDNFGLAADVPHEILSFATDPDLKRTDPAISDGKSKKSNDLGTRSQQHHMLDVLCMAKS